MSRSRTSYTNWTAIYDSIAIDDGTTPLGAWDLTYTYPHSAVSSVIIDSPIGRGFKSVSHSKFRHTRFASLTTPMSSHAGYGSAHRCSVSLNYYNDGFPSGAPEPSCDLYFTDAITSLLNDAAGSMPLSASLVVNLIELKQLKTLVPSLLAGFTALRKAKWVFGQRSAKELAGSYLAKKFGLDPLIGDVGSFLDVRAQVQERIKVLESRNGRVVRIAKRTSPVTAESSGTYVHGSTTTHQFIQDYTVKVEKKGVVSADVASFFVNDESSQIKLYSSALGLSAPLSNIWELIPFSFVVDWFLPIGSAFQRLESKLGMHETVRTHVLSNFGYSIKSKVSFDSSLILNKSDTYPGWSGTVGSGPASLSESYIRERGVPASGPLVPPVGWSISRSALSVALIIQKAVK